MSGKQIGLAIALFLLFCWGYYLWQQRQPGEELERSRKQLNQEQREIMRRYCQSEAIRANPSRKDREDCKDFW